jgi:hypothetical protein
MVQYTHFARMVDHGKGTIQTISFGYLKGIRKSFSTTEGFVPVDPTDLGTLKAVCKNGEPPWRGGQGAPLFQVVTREEAVEILKAENLARILKGEGGQQAHAMFALMGGGLGAPPAVAPPVPAMQTVTTAGPVAGPAASASLHESEPTFTPPAPTGGPGPVAPVLGQRRRGGKPKAGG